MTGIIKANVQLGDSVTPSQNFTLTATAADGTLNLHRGNAGASLGSVLTVDTVGNLGVTAPGTAALPSYSFTADPNTGTWSPAADTWAVSTGGVERVRASSTGVAVTGSITSSTSISLKRDVDNLYTSVQGGTAGATSAVLTLTGPSYAAASTAFIDATVTTFRSLNGAVDRATISSTGEAYLQWVADGGITDAYIPPVVVPPTPEQVQSSIVTATQQRLDDFAKTRNYDGILSACTYAPSLIDRFRIDGVYCVGARDNTWAALYQFMADVQAGTKPMPTSFADVEPLLPTLAWPA